MDFNEFRGSIEDPGSVYVLRTDQEYLKKKVLELVESQVEEGARSFDWAVFDLKKDSSQEKDRTQEAVDVARTLPWMSGRRWVYVKNADQETGPLSAYLSAPSQRTVLILETPRKVAAWSKYPTIEMPSKVDVPKWLRQKVEEQGYSAEPRALEVLADLIGDDLQRLESELEKQFLLQLEARKITLESVIELTQEARERDIFELIGALASRRADLALQLLNQLFDSGMSAQQITSMLYWNFKRLLVAWELLEEGRGFPSIVKRLKIWSYNRRPQEIRKYGRSFLIDLLLRLRETDRLSKTTRTELRFHLERVVIDTCRGASV